MNFPIPVNMTVDSGEAIQMTVQGDVTVPCVVDLRISPNVHETYDGPYSVTPSESVQTLETDEKLMADNVSVGAIPSDYVGSSVPRKTSADLTASGPTVTAPAGYYASSAQKTIDEAILSSGGTFHIKPNMSVNTSGVVSCNYDSTDAIMPIQKSGYADSNSMLLVGLNVSKTLQLPTQAAQTVTPTETEQIAVAAQKYTTGEVKVAAIPSDYIGSDVPQKSSSDLTASGATVTAPAGYYQSDATKTIPTANSMTFTATFVPPQLSVDINGIVSAYVPTVQNLGVRPITSDGFVSTSTVFRYNKQGGDAYLHLPTQAAQTITPTTTDQTIASGQFLTGAQTISAIAPPYYDMSGKDAWLGADATLVKEITLTNVKLADTAFASWTPSTTATDILATRTAGTFTASNMPDYDYYICWETVIPIEYQSGAVDKARGIYLAAYHVQAIVRRASSYANYQAGNANSNVNVSAFTGGNFYRYYGSTQGTITYTNSASYGFYGTVTANTISSTTAASPTITLKTPKVTARCSTTYMSTANAALIDQDKTVIKQKCRVYRVKKASFMQGVWYEVMRLMQEVDPS